MTRNWQLPALVLALLVSLVLLGYGAFGQRVPVKERQASGAIVQHDTGGLALVDKATLHTIATPQARPEIQRAITEAPAPSPDNAPATSGVPGCPT